MGSAVKVGEIHDNLMDSDSIVRDT